MFNHVKVLLALAAVTLYSSFAFAQPPQIDCKQEIVAILAGMDALPAHEETKTTITETKSNPKEAHQVVSSKKARIVRVPPDRFSITLWKNDQLRLESISVGSRTWDREPGEEWKLEPTAQPGTIGYFIDDVAA